MSENMKIFLALFLGSAIGTFVGWVATVIFYQLLAIMIVLK